MYGKVDRGGSREGKKSLRKNKIAIVKAEKKSNKPTTEESTKKAPCPPLNMHTQPMSMIDVGCGLCNRRFEHDLSKVVQRAQQTGVDAMLILSNDFEKQEALQKLAKEYNSIIYFIPGIHPDNIKRTNDKLVAQRLTTLKESAMSAECCAISMGLDFSREVGTHYSQEKLFKDSMQICAELELPAIINQIAASEQIVDKLRSCPDEVPYAAIYNFTGDEKELNNYLSLEIEVFFILTGILCDSSDKGASLRALLPKIPLERILIASDSPLSTPQNIQDAYIREARNEPSNLPFVFEMMASTLSTATGSPVTPQFLAESIRNNTKKFFGFIDKDEVVVEAPTTDTAVDSAAVDKEVDTNKNETDSQPVKPQNGTKANGSGSGKKEKEKESKSQKQLHNLIKEVKIVDNKDEESDSEEEVEGETTEENTETPAVTSTEVKYACKTCRKLLFVSGDVAPHVFDEAFADKANVTTKNEVVEVDACQMIFVKDINWAAKASDEETAVASGSEGKLLCPGCQAKLGRWCVTHPLPCTCGKLSSVPAYMVKKKVLDIILPLDSLSTRASEDLQDGQDTTKEKVKKAKKKKSGPTKKNKANFSSFRNKSYG